LQQRAVAKCRLSCDYPPSLKHISTSVPICDTWLHSYVTVAWHWDILRPVPPGSFRAQNFVSDSEEKRLRFSWGKTVECVEWTADTTKQSRKLHNEKLGNLIFARTEINFIRISATFLEDIAVLPRHETSKFSVVYSVTSTEEQNTGHQNEWPKWLAEWLSASQKGRCYMELVN